MRCEKSLIFLLFYLFQPTASSATPILKVAKLQNARRMKVFALVLPSITTVSILETNGWSFIKL